MNVFLADQSLSWQKALAMHLMKCGIVRQEFIFDLQWQGINLRIHPFFTTMLIIRPMLKKSYFCADFRLILGWCRELHAEMLFASNIRLELFIIRFWTVFPLSEKKNFIRFHLKKHNCSVFTNYQDTKLCCFWNLSLGFILKILKFQSRYSHRVYILIKKKL